METVIDRRFRVRNVFTVNKPWLSWWPVNNKAVFEEGKQLYYLDSKAIESYCSFIDLQFIPKIVGKADGDIGVAYMGLGIPGYIHIRQDLIPIAASITLAHELKHCKQHEDRGFVPIKTERHVSPDGLGWKEYWNHPIEREAREYEIYGLETMLVKEL